MKALIRETVLSQRSKRGEYRIGTEHERVETHALGTTDGPPRRCSTAGTTPSVDSCEDTGDKRGKREGVTQRGSTP